MSRLHPVNYRPPSAASQFLEDLGRIATQRAANRLYRMAQNVDYGNIEGLIVMFTEPELDPTRKIHSDTFDMLQHVSPWHQHEDPDLRKLAGVLGPIHATHMYKKHQDAFRPNPEYVRHPTPSDYKFGGTSSPVYATGQAAGQAQPRGVFSLPAYLATHQEHALTPRQQEMKDTKIRRVALTYPQAKRQHEFRNAFPDRLTRVEEFLNSRTWVGKRDLPLERRIVNQVDQLYKAHTFGKAENRKAITKALRTLEEKYDDYLTKLRLGE